MSEQNRDLKSGGLTSLESSPPAVSLDDLWTAIERRMGVCPSFFKLAWHEPGVAGGLFDLAKIAYLDSPLPTLFKEKLFVYLSRLCQVRYCLARHCAFLLGRGHIAGDPDCTPLSLDQVLALLDEPWPEPAELPEYLRALEQTPAPLADWPDFDSTLGRRFRVACAMAFLEPHRAAQWLAALRRLLGPQRYEQLMLFLAFIRTAHFWAQVHPELAFEPDLELLLQEQQALAEPLLHKTDEATRFQLGEQLHEELSELRRSKRAEEALRASQQQLQFVTDHAPVFLAHCDQDRRYKFVNRLYANLFGRQPVDIVGRHSQEVLGEDAYAHASPYMAAALSGRPTAHDLTLPTTPAGPRIVHVAYAPEFNTSGQVVGFVAAIQDITERKQAEEERRQLDAQIQQAQKLESLGVLAGGIAHDFNNLLTSMLGYASLALLKLPAESVAYPMLREIEQAAQRAADLAQQMLAYSGKGKFTIQVLRLDTLVQEMTKLLGTVISKKATLQLDLAPATVKGDATQIRQIVMNLITNASDALEGQNGAIHIRTGVRQVDDTAVLRSLLFPEALPAGPYAYVEVEDNGYGMSADTLAKIFDPFFTTKFTGRGLGLAAVLGIVRGHRGVIKVVSTPDQGTLFQMFFPSVGVEVENALAFAPKAMPRGHGTVLIVEDEEIVRTFARNVLEGAGFQVLEAHDGHEGLDIVGRHSQEIALVLLDLTMPRLNGVETLRELHHLQPDIPVLVMSGYSEQDVSARFAGLRASGFIQKPFRPIELVTQVCQLLPSKGANEPD